MANQLAGIDAKIGRAKSHLADLQERLSVALHPDTHTFRVEFDAEIKRNIYRVYDLPVVDPEWPLLIGEVLYQLRSALDHLAWQLVELDGQTPDEQTQFPVRESLLDKNGERMPLKVLLPQVKDREILRLVDACQPYNDLDGGERTPFDAHRHPLWHIARLNNVDKHRLLLVVVCALNIEGMYWGLPPGVSKSPDPYLNAAALKEGSKVASFDFDGAEAPADFNPHLSLKVVVREPDAPNLAHAEIAAVLDGLIRYIEWDVLFDFRMLFDVRTGHDAPSQEG